jgi:hypothetical protein
LVDIDHGDFDVRAFLGDDRHGGATDIAGAYTTDVVHWFIC